MASKRYAKEIGRRKHTYNDSVRRWCLQEKMNVCPSLSEPLWLRRKRVSGSLVDLLGIDYEVQYKRVTASGGISVDHRYLIKVR